VKASIQHERRESNRNVRPLRYILEHSSKPETLIGAKVGKKMQTYVEESVKPEHSAKTNELREMKYLPHRRDTKREDQKPQRPVTGRVLQRFNRVDA